MHLQVCISLIIQARLLLLPFSCLLPSAQDRKYIHLSAEEVLGLSCVVVFSLTL